MDNSATQFGKAQNPTGDTADNSQSTNALLASIMALLAQTSPGGKPPDASALKVDPTMGVSLPSGSGNSGGSDTGASEGSSMPSDYPYLGQGQFQRSPDGKITDYNTPLLMGQKGEITVSQNNLNQLSDSFSALLKQLGPVLTDRSTDPAFPAPAATPSAQPVYTPYNPVPSMPLSNPAPSPVVPVPANPAATSVPASVAATQAAPVEAAQQSAPAPEAVQAPAPAALQTAPAPQAAQAAAPAAPVYAQNSFTPPSAGSLPKIQMPQPPAAAVQSPSVTSLGTLPEASSSDSGMAGLGAGAYSGGGGATVGDSMGGAGMSTGQISAVTSGISGIGKGIGQMFQGVTLQTPQPGSLPPLSQFKPPTMY